MNLKEQLLAAKKAYNEMIDEKRSLLEGAEKNTADKNISEVRSKVEEIQKRMKAKEAEIKDLEALIEEAKNSRSGFNINPEKPEPEGEDVEHRMINNFLHMNFRDAVTDGLKSPDATVTIPKDIKYVPTEEKKTVQNLLDYVNNVPVTTASGTYPIVKRAAASLHTVQELDKNPDLAKPAFLKVDWSVDTYRGAIPLSQEAIDDSAADLVSIVANNANEQKINTLNSKIAEVLKGFTAKAVTGTDVDVIKEILNVDLDPAYTPVIIASQSFYQWLDTLKDKNGRYMLNDPITTGSPAMLLGVPVIKVADEIFGAKGDAKAFIGDAKEAVMVANRKDLQVRWTDNEVYGQYLQAVIRFGVTKADENAGFFVTATPTPSKAS